METQRLEQILLNFPQTKVAVLGDFFLDLYIQMDRNLSEFSLETHKEAFQATAVRGQPGAAGVVSNNLAALGAQHSAIGIIGKDGFGYILKNALASIGADIKGLIESEERLTPTYAKPIMKEVDGINVELNRIDIKNRTANPSALNDLLLEQLQQAWVNHDGILVLEQVRNDGFGTLSPVLRNSLTMLMKQNPEKVILVDSRHFGSAYRHVGLKMNLEEAKRALGDLSDQPTHIDLEDNVGTSLKISQSLWDMMGHNPIFITLGEVGISGFDESGFFHHPGFVTEGYIDIVGAGDSVLAAIGLSLCAGATSAEAAYIGNLAGSITIQQIGTTGIATQKDILHRHHEYQDQIKG